MSSTKLTCRQRLRLSISCSNRMGCGGGGIALESSSDFITGSSIMNRFVMMLKAVEVGGCDQTRLQ